MKIRVIAANMTEVHHNGGVVLFSYDTPVAYLKDGLHYVTDKKHSRTTTRHINKWLAGDKCATVSQEYLDSEGYLRP
jgi:hypothetical protein